MHLFKSKFEIFKNKAVALKIAFRFRMKIIYGVNKIK